MGTSLTCLTTYTRTCKCLTDESPTTPTKNPCTKIAQIVSWVLNQTARVHSVRPTRERVANPGDLLKVLQADQRYLVFWVS